MNAFKQQCINLRKKDCTLPEIMKITGRSKTSVYFHIKDIALSKKKQKEISENSRRRALQIAATRKGKALRPHRTFDTWTPNRVLLVAHLIFDGELRRNTCGYSNRSRALIARVEMLFRETYSFVPSRHVNAQSGVHKIYYHNVGLGIFMLKKADELLKCAKQLSRDCQKEFIRAFFDDEGCMDFRPKENRRRVRGYQKDREVLVLIQRLLVNFQIASHIKDPNEIVITGKENLKKFQKEINFSKGVRVNGKRTNNVWKKNIEKRELLDMAIKSFKT